MGEPRAKRLKMAPGAWAPAAASAPTPVAAYRYNERNVFSLLLQGSGLDTPLIYEAAHTFGVLDKYPLARGHSLLIVKHPAATLLDELPPAVAQAAFADLQALARAVQRATGCAGLRVVQTNGPAAGQTVPQLHFHLIPVYSSVTPDTTASAAASAAATATPAPEAPAPAPAASATAGTAAAAAAAAQPPREPLDAAEAGPLLAHIRNVLPEAYAPGFHVWAENEGAMEAMGWALQDAFCTPGTVLALSGQLGAGKSTICRGFVRAFVRDPLLEVPSPTFLLCLSYTDDHAYDRRDAAAAAAAAAGADSAGSGGGEAPAPAAAVDAAAADVAPAGGASAPVSPPPPPARAGAVHHMDPYRLGAKNDKMAGLIDFDSALTADACLVEWPDRMPASVLSLMEGKGVAVDVSGMGAQASGRLVSITSLGARFTPPPPRARGGGGGAAAKGGGVCSGGAAAAAPAAAAAVPGAAAVEDAAAMAAAAAAARGEAFAEKLRAWRAAYPSSMPPADVAWRGGGGAAAAGANGALADAALAAGAAGAAASTIAAAAAAAIASGDPSRVVVLGIESSCDDTAAAVIRGDGTVLAHRVASQAGLHEQYGGVKPDVARHAHAAAIEGTVDGALAEAGLTAADLTAVAVTAGPGLALCLQVGVRHGLALAARHSLPYIPVHHMEAHALMTRLPHVNEHPMQFPSLLLLVSGGHNMLVLCEGVGRHRIIGTTLDDSVGECFDKIARLAGISAIPGGPHLERLAATARPDAATRYPLTMPLTNGAQKDSCNFSFSGLKTQVASLIAQKRRELGLPDAPPPVAPGAGSGSGGGGGVQQDGDDDASAGAPDATAASAAGEATPSGAADAGAGAGAAEEPAEAEARAEAEAEIIAACADIAASFQRMAVRFLQQRTRRALQWLRDDAAQRGGAGFVVSLVVAGGVAANAAVRGGLSEVAAEFGLPCVYPPVRYCTDNGLMVAWTGVERLRLGLYQAPPRQCEGAALDANVQVIPRWPMGPMDPRSTANKGRAHIKILH